MTSSANLKRARMRAGLSGAELARRLEMERGTYGRIERGQRKLPFELARRIAEILDCSVDDLITGENVGSNEGLVRVEVPVGAEASIVDLPVFGTSELLSTNTVKMVRTGNFVARPFNVIGNDQAYAMHVFNDLSAPRFEVGDIITVDPTRPAIAGQWAVISVRKDDDVLAEIWRLDHLTETSAAVSRNGATERFKRDDLVSIDLIVQTQLV